MNTNLARIIGVSFIALVIGGGLIWYMATHPASVAHAPETATSTTAVADTGPQHLTQNGKYYSVDTQYPASTPLATSVSADANAAAVLTMKSFEQNAASTFITENKLDNLTAEDIAIQGLDQGRSYSLTMEYKQYSSPATVSYVYTIYADTLGAHPNSSYQTFTFDSKTGAELSLSDLFVAKTDVAGRLSTIARAKLPGVMKANTGYAPDADMLAAGTTAKIENFQDFYLSGKNLVILFPPYAIAAYAAGPQMLSIPLSELTTILKPEYGGQ